MRPDHGGRLELKLQTKDEHAVVYEAELATPARLARGQLSLDPNDGSVDIELDGEADAWLVDHARAVARSLWRAHAEAGWPRRVTRWRAAPEPKE